MDFLTSFDKQIAGLADQIADLGIFTGSRKPGSGSLTSPARRVSLQEIIRRHPGSAMARQAQQALDAMSPEVGGKGPLTGPLRSLSSEERAAIHPSTQRSFLNTPSSPNQTAMSRLAEDAPDLFSSPRSTGYSASAPSLEPETPSIRFGPLGSTAEPGSPLRSIVSDPPTVSGFEPTVSPRLLPPSSPVDTRPPSGGSMGRMRFEEMPPHLADPELQIPGLVGEDVVSGPSHRTIPRGNFFEHEMHTPRPSTIPSVPSGAPLPPEVDEPLAEMAGAGVAPNAPVGVEAVERAEAPVAATSAALDTIAGAEPFFGNNAIGRRLMGKGRPLKIDIGKPARVLDEILPWAHEKMGSPLTRMNQALTRAAEGRRAERAAYDAATQAMRSPTPPTPPATPAAAVEGVAGAGETVAPVTEGAAAAAEEATPAVRSALSRLMTSSPVRSGLRPVGSLAEAGEGAVGLLGKGARGLGKVMGTLGPALRVGGAGYELSKAMAGEGDRTEDVARALDFLLTGGLVQGADWAVGQLAPERYGGYSKALTPEEGLGRKASDIVPSLVSGAMHHANEALNSGDVGLYRRLMSNLTDKLSSEFGMDKGSIAALYARTVNKKTPEAQAWQDFDYGKAPEDRTDYLTSEQHAQREAHDAADMARKAEFTGTSYWNPLSNLLPTSWGGAS